MRYEMLEEVQKKGLQTGVMDVIPRLHARVLVKVAMSNSTESRYVPALIMDYVEGTSMEGMLVVAFSDEQRDRILKAVLKVWARMFTTGVILVDPCPRDFILRNEFSEHPEVATVELWCMDLWEEPKSPVAELRDASPVKLLSSTVMNVGADFFMHDGWFTGVSTTWKLGWKRTSRTTRKNMFTQTC
ncbi:hypothetical protein CC86DRAFT_51925 [Ophiobolus disseminans]|uniref:Uncharacterized protein n=1 Tax=Ophiobolus disseminans TaxID=1469910 RepID=A0A6A6ZTX5_9PLEO|nr:hypothetical protein CC86DRAFT_51925 [Ophiobolus disseminans]